MKQSSMIFNHKGTVLLQTLLLFFIFVSIASSVIAIRTLEISTIAWQQKALFRMDLEIQALIYYHQHHPSHHEAVYIYHHWITYWYENSTLIINFDGSYAYSLVFDMDEKGRLLNRAIQDD